MPTKPTPRRAYGSGSLTPKTLPSGRTVWVALLYRSGRKIKRTWPRRVPGGRDGLTRTQAEERLRQEIGKTSAVARVRGDRPDIAEVARRYLLAPAKGGKPRKPSTVENIESEVRVHITPFFRERPTDRIEAEDIADLISNLETKGLSPKTIRNVIGTLSALFNFAKAPRRRWATFNPCDGAELPEIPETDEIRFLTMPELHKLIEHARPGMYRDTDQALYLVAAMTGLRLGELLALRWRDVDWIAGVIRVRRNYVRGRYGTPKSRRSSRALPMADEVGGVLDLVFRASAHQGDDDLVFGHPSTGRAIPKANVTRRLHKALDDVGLDRDHVFHEYADFRVMPMWFEEALLRSVFGAGWSA
jgi:integrase